MSIQENFGIGLLRVCDHDDTNETLMEKDAEFGKININTQS